MNLVRLQPSWQSEGTPLRHSWAGLGNIDQFRWLVRKDCLDQLKLAHTELGVRNVRAVGMFDDEMRVLANDPTLWRLEKEKRGPRTNWQIVDYVIESLLDIGIKPVFTTTFMPGAIASGDKTVFTTKGNITLPKDLSLWERLVRESVRHVIDRFGIEEVRSWYFEVWNEPNLSGFFDGTQDNFHSLWQRTCSAIKGVDSQLRMGGPSTARGEWIREFIDWTRRNQCDADYIISHCYNNDSEFGALSPFDGPQEDRSSNSPNFTNGVVRGARAILDESGFQGELHFNEWGRSWHVCDHQRETENEAAYIVKTMAEVSQQADYFAYWCLSDIYDQLGYGAETFHGNYGMLNLQGIRKPSWHAHRLLNKLGNRRIGLKIAGADGSVGAIATTRDKLSHVLVSDYQQQPGSHSTYKVTVPLPPACGASPRFHLWRIGALENNAPALWRQLKSPAYLRREERQALVSASDLQESSGAVNIESGPTGPEAVFAAPSPGVALLEIVPSC